MISYKLHFVGYTFQDYTLLIKNVTVELKENIVIITNIVLWRVYTFSCRKKEELQATFFVRFARSVINIWFSTNEIEETNKKIKLRWREVDHNLMAMLSVWKTV